MPNLSPTPSRLSLYHSFAHLAKGDLDVPAINLNLMFMEERLLDSVEPRFGTPGLGEVI